MINLYNQEHALQELADNALEEEAELRQVDLAAAAAESAENTMQICNQLYYERMREEGE